MNGTTDLPPADHGTPATAMVQTWKLSKVYRTGFWMNQTNESLKACDLRVEAGETFGLLGPNGAGKTTLLKILLGIIRPTGGRAVLLGKPLGDRSVRQRIGYLPENAFFYDYLTGWEFLEFAAGLFGISKAVQQQRIPRLLDLVGLSLHNAQKKQLRQYSKGMVQRIGMAQALINDPDVIFLDEPMSGLDPTGRYQVREIILSLKEQGKTIFFNSHILADVEQICDRFAILNKGKLLCCGSLGDLLHQGSDRYQVTVRGGTKTVLARWLPDLMLKNNLWVGTLQGDLQEFLASLKVIDAQLVAAKTAGATLEDFFIDQVKQDNLTMPAPAPSGSVS